MIKEYLERKWVWVDKNPRLASWLGWIKGLIKGLITNIFKERIYLYLMLIILIMICLILIMQIVMRK